jgi:digeranylgeranylglycerophospholipid reductase
MAPEVPCDVLVVGAGPAGSCAARSAAEEGVSTVLIDAKVRIGEQPHCGEFAPARLFAEFDLDKACIIQPVEFMETRILQSLDECAPVRRSEIPSPGFMLDRVRFDRDLARRASARGAIVHCGTRLARVEGGRWVARSPQGEVAFRPKLVIAADGALSSVAGVLGLDPLQVIKGIQVEAPLSEPLNRTMVFLERAFVDGYGWVFPKGSVANVGLGVARDQNAHEILERFLEGLRCAGLIRPGILARSGGTIPVSGLRKALVQDNVVFCGDAAGLTHPITGAGIPQAVFAGHLAGRAAAAAVKTVTHQPLREYEADVRGRYESVIKHALSKRTAMTAQRNDPDFGKVCEDSWIAFKGYRKRIREAV